MQLKPFNVTVCIFEPAKGLESGQTYVLPVDSPDAEHACASTIANAASLRRRRKTGRNGSRPARYRAPRSHFQRPGRSKPWRGFSGGNLREKTDGLDLSVM